MSKGLGLLAGTVGLQVLSKNAGHGIDRWEAGAELPSISHEQKAGFLGCVSCKRTTGS